MMKKELFDNNSYYIAGSASGQDEMNPVFWFATSRFSVLYPQKRNSLVKFLDI